jgi:hypothetical protein
LRGAGRTVLALVLLHFAATAVDAQSPETQEAPSRAEMRRACTADYERFCRETRPGSAELRQCFAEHAADLSTDCRDVIRRVEGEAESKPD